MGLELAGAILFFGITVFALLYSVAKTSSMPPESFPNRRRFFAGLFFCVLAALVLVFMSFPGYPLWFVPIVYPLVKTAFLLLVLSGFILTITSAVALPHLTGQQNREVGGRVDRLTLLENVRQITSQPLPMTEMFMLALKELSGFLEIKRGAIFLVNPAKREMYLAAQIGFEKDDIGRLERFPLGQDMVSRSASEQIPFVSGDLSLSDAASRSLLIGGRTIPCSAAAVPLSSRDRSLGALLVLSETPYRFEKRDRMLLNAAAEALASVVEAGRLGRDNLKLNHALEENQCMLANLRSGLKQLIKTDGNKDALRGVCRYLVEKYGVIGTRVVRVLQGEMIDLAHFETALDSGTQSESYRIAVVDGIKRKKMVVLNQEARGEGGAAFISRSSLLCPLSHPGSGDYALLVEAAGNGLPLTEQFIADVEGIVNLASTAIAVQSLRETDSLNQSAVRALLNILKIKHDLPESAVYKRFLEESVPLLAPESLALIFVRDNHSGYHLSAGWNTDMAELSGCTFLPGEGPIGRTAGGGEMTEYIGRDRVDQAWSDLEPGNHDFLRHLLGEKGSPAYQFNIPIKILDDAVAVMAVFQRDMSSSPARPEKRLLLLAAQLLSIKLSTARVDAGTYEDLGSGVLQKAGHILNKINNDLSTVVGRAQLLERQSDVSGRTRYAAGEILKAAEAAADAVRRLQEGITPPESTTSAASEDSFAVIRSFLSTLYVTGNLYLFEGNRPVMLQNELAETAPFRLRGGDWGALFIGLLKTFVTFLEEGEELLLKSGQSDGVCHISLVRGSRERQRLFNPAGQDFGDPEVLPAELADGRLRQFLIENRATVSFDRFGRRPTYISFRFETGAPTPTGEAGPQKVSPAALKILAIDDQQMILDLLSGICQSLGLRLTAIREPLEGIRLFKQEVYDIVMVDLAMGDVSGWDVAREVKKHSPQTPVILMTGWGINLDADEVGKSGVDFTLAKPFKIEQLTDVISRARLKHQAT